MKPITHAKITFWMTTLVIAPEILFLVGKVLWGQITKKPRMIIQATKRSKELFAYRKDKTKQTYNFHKNGYMFVMKVK